MPFYEYQCTDCHEKFVRQQKMSDAPVTDCPTCAGTVRKVFNAPGVAVRGGGCPMEPVCAPGGG